MKNLIIFNVKRGDNNWTWEETFHAEEHRLTKSIDMYLEKRNFQFWTKEEVRWKKK